MSSGAVQPHSKKRIAYYYDGNIGNYYYGQGHVMKPNRIRMTHHLLLNYSIYRHLEVYRPQPASFDELTRFHAEEYMDFLRLANPDNLKQYNKQMLRFNVGEDCPVFEGLYEFCQISSGGSLAAAVKLNKRRADIAINWMGGLHHAKKSEASGFCYSNDIVLGILELLKYHQRVLYVDIDVHHGDGVEEAFYTTDRVMTCSFHKYGDFFPGTGDLKVMKKVMETFQPNAVVLQCGADSLNGDRLGPFNLTLKGHGECVRFFRDCDIPLMLVGGGGYTPKNVARCWTYETAIAIEKDIQNEIPFNDYYEYYGPTFRLHIEPSNANNDNTREYLQKIQCGVMENLRQLPHAPGVQMQPMQDDGLKYVDEDIHEDMRNPDIRLPPSITDKLVAGVGDYYDSERGSGECRKEISYKKRPATSSGDGGSCSDDPLALPDNDANGATIAVKKMRMRDDDDEGDLLNELEDDEGEVEDPLADSPINNPPPTGQAMNSDEEEVSNDALTMDTGSPAQPDDPHPTD